MTRLSMSEQFCVLFENLKAAAGTPQRMLTFYGESKAVRDACRALLKFLSESGLEHALLYGRRGKVVPSRRVAFEAGWRDYVENWRFRLSHDDDDLGPLLDDDESEAWESYWKAAHIELILPSAAPEMELESGGEGSATIGQGIEDLRAILNFYLDFQRGYKESDELNELEHGCSAALFALNHLIDTIGLDIPSVFRRWRNVPVTLMPAHVSNRYGASDRGSLPRLLDDAIRAYLFGAPAAAFAMCRAAYKMIKKEHYPPGELNNVIIKASIEYEFISIEKIRIYITTANKVLHNYNHKRTLTSEDDRTLRDFITTLKFLIERAPRP